MRDKSAQLWDPKKEILYPNSVTSAISAPSEIQ